MELLIVGLAIFIGVHLIPARPGLRAAFVRRLGLNGYKIAFSVISALGLVLIVLGYRAAPEEQIFEPSQTARLLLPYGMALAFILMAAAYAPGRLRRLLRHPMLAGVLIWSVLHLLANGDLAANILFGTFAVWSVFAILSAEKRGQKLGGAQANPRADVLAVIAGLAAFALALFLHAPLLGVAPY